MFGYAPHRHRLPLENSRISASDPARPSASSPTADMIWPGVQNPHCRASCRMNASCTGCSRPSSARPSMVVTRRLSHCAASIRHDSTRLPSSKIVQAPHAPWSQPFLVPVSPRWSRSASSRVTRLSS